MEKTTFVESFLFAFGGAGSQIDFWPGVVVATIVAACALYQLAVLIFHKRLTPLRWGRRGRSAPMSKLSQAIVASWWVLFACLFYSSVFKWHFYEEEVSWVLFFFIPVMILLGLRDERAHRSNQK